MVLNYLRLYQPLSSVFPTRQSAGDTGNNDASFGKILVVLTKVITAIYCYCYWEFTLTVTRKLTDSIQSTPTATCSLASLTPEQQSVGLPVCRKKGQ